MKFATVFSRPEQQPFQGQGIVTRTIHTQFPGRLYFQATYWPARLANPVEDVVLQPGQTVDVVGREGLTLLIQPESRPAATQVPFQAPDLSPMLVMEVS